MRQFCVDIAPPFNWRNIDAALLREHSVRRICAHYKILQIFANLTHASTHALNLRKKNQPKKLTHAPKNERKKGGKEKVQAGFEPGTFQLRSRHLTHSATPTALGFDEKNNLYSQSKIVACEKLRETLAIFLQIWRIRKKCAKDLQKIPQSELNAQLRTLAKQKKDKILVSLRQHYLKTAVVFFKKISNSMLVPRLRFPDVLAHSSAIFCKFNACVNACVSFANNFFSQLRLLRQNMCRYATLRPKNHYSAPLKKGFRKTLAIFLQT